MSLFYTARYEQLFPIPMIAFERLEALSDIPPEQAVPQVLAECCNKPKPTEEEILYFLERLKGDSREAQERMGSAPEPKTHVRPEKSLGTSFQEMLGKMDAAKLLLWACSYDYARAEHLYTQVDRSIASQIIDDFLRVQYERNTYLFEAVLYGFGGKYNSDDGQGDMVDMTDMDASQIMAMLAPQ